MILGLAANFAEIFLPNYHRESFLVLWSFREIEQGTEKRRFYDLRAHHTIFDDFGVFNSVSSVIGADVDDFLTCA